MRRPPLSGWARALASALPARKEADGRAEPEAPDDCDAERRAGRAGEGRAPRGEGRG